MPAELPATFGEMKPSAKVEAFGKAFEARALPSLDSLVVPLYRYCWGNNPKRATMQGRVCRVICRGTMNSAMIEFMDNGQREVVSRNAIRRHNKEICTPDAE